MLLQKAIEINFCSKAYRLVVRRHFMLKILRYKIGTQYLPLKQTDLKKI